MREYKEFIEIKNIGSKGSLFTYGFSLFPKNRTNK